MYKRQALVWINNIFVFKPSNLDLSIISVPPYIVIDANIDVYKRQKHGNVKWAFVDYFSSGKLQGSLTDKKCAYKVKDLGGKFLVGLGKFNYLERCV